MMSTRFLGVALLVMASACLAPPPISPLQGRADLPYSYTSERDRHVHGWVPNASLAEELHEGLAPNTAGLFRSQSATSVLYDASAPATVLLTTPRGHGSGVIVDPRGYVLTNYHVAVTGETKDFDIEAKVTMAQLGSDGEASPGAEFRARAIKIDPSRDLALLQIVDPPADLPTVKLASNDPRPGGSVVAMGHAGVGFGWAVKRCSISAVGTLENHVASIVGLRDDRYSEEERSQAKKMLAKASKKLGRYVQTDCLVLPGDSGGPLFDENSQELVGLNFALRRDTTAGGALAFHIHVAELREFLQQIPKQPGSFVPDPWELGGAEARLDDTDGNGDYDTFRLGGTCGGDYACHALFVDMHQRSFPKGSEIPSVDRIYEERSFKSDFIVLQRARHASERALLPTTEILFFFDSDGDGVLESLLVVNGASKTSTGFRRSGPGYRRDKSLDKKEISSDLFSAPARQELFATYREVLNSGLRSVATARRTSAVEFKVLDFTQDGIPETVRAETRLDERVLVDLDQKSLPRLEGDALLEALGTGEIGFDFVAVSSAPVRVWYDTNNDGHLDLLLEAESWNARFAAQATRYAKDGTPSPAFEHVGRALLRPGLLRDKNLGQRLAKVLEKAKLATLARDDDGRSTLPDLRPGTQAQVEELARTPGQHAAIVTDGSRYIVLLDLDGDTLRGRNAPASVDTAVREGRFDAEFAYVFDGKLAWAFYDRNNDGTFDAVYVARGANPLEAFVHYELDKRGSITAANPVDEKMWLALRFTPAAARRSFTQLAKQILESP